MLSTQINILMAGVNFDFEFQLCKWRALVRLIVGNDGAGPVLWRPGLLEVVGGGGHGQGRSGQRPAPGPRAVEFWATPSRTGSKGLETVLETHGLKISQEHQVDEESRTWGSSYGCSGCQLKNIMKIYQIGLVCEGWYEFIRKLYYNKLKK